jgi:hypothetical protein
MGFKTPENETLITGCSKMFGCKARANMKNEAYFCVRRNEE